ncbi:hypothetical protein MELB17_20656 [Marinobacter sp. ELB17]|nr:hypothetical protein MELB17_20656 [Marinobacter sp. ELB17]
MGKSGGLYRFTMQMRTALVREGLEMPQAGLSIAAPPAGGAFREKALLEAQ